MFFNFILYKNCILYFIASRITNDNRDKCNIKYYIFEIV